MNTLGRITASAIVGIAGIVTTCALSAGAASAKPEPLAPNGASVPVTSPAASLQPDATVRTPPQQRLFQAHIQHLLEEFADRDAVTAKSPRVGHPHGHGAVETSSPLPGTVAQTGTGAATQSGSQRQSHESGNGTDIAVIAITAVAGLALGAAGSTASRRLRARSGLAA